MNFGNRNNTNTGLLILTIIGVTIALAAGGFLIAQLTPVIFPTQASAESQQVDGLFKVLLGIGGAIFLLVEGLLLYSVIRFRVREDDTGDGPTIHGNTTLELIWTAIPAVIVLVLVIYSYQVWVDIRAPKEDELVVDVTGQRFAWAFSYADDRVEQPIRSEVMHVYAGRPVRAVLDTEDVIHSFYIPAMRVKQDLLPGRTTEIRFTPTEPGEYPIRCAELCGGGHGDMVTTIVVHEDEETYLAEFVDPAVERILNPPEDPAERGRQIISTYPCASCHTLTDVGWEGQQGPSLNGVADRASTRVSGQTAGEYLYTSLFDPRAYTVPGFPAELMPNFQHANPDTANFIPPDDALAIIAYLCTQNDTGEQACDLENVGSLIGVEAESESN